MAAAHSLRSEHPDSAGVWKLSEHLDVKQTEANKKNGDREIDRQTDWGWRGTCELLFCQAQPCPSEQWRRSSEWRVLSVCDAADLCGLQCFVSFYLKEFSLIERTKSLKSFQGFSLDRTLQNIYIYRYRYKIDIKKVRRFKVLGSLVFWTVSQSSSIFKVLHLINWKNRFLLKLSCRHWNQLSKVRHVKWLQKLYLNILKKINLSA